MILSHPRVHPKTLPPKLIGAISKSVFLINLFFILNILFQKFFDRFDELVKNLDVKMSYILDFYQF
jgi:hypothetical protein